MKTRSYKTKKFAQFARRLKKKGLWNKFRVLEYYFQIYKNPYTDIGYLMQVLENDENALLSNEDWGYTCFNMCDDDTIELKDVFRHFEIH
jgi:hypothetical protein